MQVVEVRREAKSLDGTVDVLLDVSSGICDAAIAKDIKTAFRRNYRARLTRARIDRQEEGLTEDLVPDIVFPDEVAQKLFIHASLVDDLYSTC
jgi:hypothetical protein